MVIRIQPAQNLDSGQKIEAAVEPAAVRHRVDMTATEQRSRRLSAQGGPDVARLICRDLHGQTTKLLAEPRAGLRPRRCECDTLRTVVVAGKRTQFLEFGERTFRVERRVHVEEEFTAIESAGAHTARRRRPRTCADEDWLCGLETRTDDATFPGKPQAPHRSTRRA